MSEGMRPVAVALVALLVAACRSADPEVRARRDSSELAAREARLDTALAHRDSGDAKTPVARWVMPRRLAEISGLALTADGRLLAHGDETGRVYEIDYRRGVLTKQFSVGHPEVRGDFEAITVVDSSIYLLTSKGKLYQFREGKDGESVDYKVIETKLGNECEFEGLAYDPNLKSLLLACKHVYAKKLAGSLVIFRWKLGETGDAALSTLAVPLAQVIGANQWARVRPSDITVDPKTGNYVLVASLERALIVLTPTGQVVSAGPLMGKHPQAEGVAITRDGILIVSDEAPHNGGDGVVTLYRWQ
jgi:uncharacterized protein YjiK